MPWICPFCLLEFPDSSGQFQLQQHLTINLCDENTSSNNLKLLIQYKQKEIELAQLNFKLQKKSVAKPEEFLTKPPEPSLVKPEKCSTKTKVKEHSDQTKPDKVINNFGAENCKMIITDKLITELEEKYGESPEIYQLLMIDLLTLIHFNNEYPENRNLKFIPDSTDISVYFGNKWQNLDQDLVISEFFKGNLRRLQKLRPDGKLVEQIKSSFVDYQDDILADFNYIIELGEHPTL